MGGKWLLAGGYAGAAPSNTNVAYNFATNTWDTPPTLPIAKAAGLVVRQARSFAAPGGRGAAGGFTGTNETQVYTVPPCGTATSPTGTPPTSTPTFTPTCASGYTVATGTATLVPGTTNTGSACDDCVTAITLPFPFSLYGVAYTSAGADSNGRPPVYLQHINLHKRVLAFACRRTCHLPALGRPAHGRYVVHGWLWYLHLGIGERT